MASTARFDAAGMLENDRRQTPGTPGTPGTPAEAASRQKAPVLILGTPRSGTTWLGKIFDSHPEVIYRHEPDTVLRPNGFPAICPIEEIPQYLDAVRRYVFALKAVRQLKASGTRPVFAKSFQGFAAPPVRRALALALRAAESLAPQAPWPKRVPIPDFVRKDSEITYVIKSINLLNAAGLLARALPESRIIVLLRHPCGQVASFQHGLSTGFMQSEMSLRGFWDLAITRDLGLTEERYRELPRLERNVWAWALLYARLLEEAPNFANLMVLVYEDLCKNPLEEARKVLAFANLRWAEETAKFIEISTRSSGRERYYSLFRNPLDAAMKWKRELAPGEIARVMAIVERVLPGRFPIDGDFP